MRHQSTTPSPTGPRYKVSAPSKAWDGLADPLFSFFCYNHYSSQSMTVEMTRRRTLLLLLSLPTAFFLLIYYSLLLHCGYFCSPGFLPRNVTYYIPDLTIGLHQRRWKIGMYGVQRTLPVPARNEGQLRVLGEVFQDCRPRWNRTDGWTIQSELRTRKELFGRFLDPDMSDTSRYYARDPCNIPERVKTEPRL